MSGLQSIYILSSRMQTQMKKLDAVAVNVANSNTPGFKRQDVDFETILGGKGGQAAGKFALHRGYNSNLSQGPINTTGNPLDMALIGDGFFATQPIGGGTPTYTRDGHFTVSNEGLLINSRGEHILDEANAPISLPPNQTISVETDGTITADKVIIGKIGVFQFPADVALLRVGNNQFRNENNAVPIPAESIRVIAGAVEGSNVNPIMETVKMNEVSQAYQGAARLMGRLEDLQERVIRELPRTNR